jgi:hypothetical protein
MKKITLIILVNCSFAISVISQTIPNYIPTDGLAGGFRFFIRDISNIKLLLFSSLINLLN